MRSFYLPILHIVLLVLCLSHLELNGGPGLHSVNAQAIFLPQGTIEQRSGAAYAACSPKRMQQSSKAFAHRLDNANPQFSINFTNVCQDNIVNFQFNDVCGWVGGKARMTAAVIDDMCFGATRKAHWHHAADEWGYVIRGTVQTYVASTSSLNDKSSSGLPWPSSVNTIGANGVWYFPQGWLHGLTCLTKEEDGGCKVAIVFNGAEMVPIDNHNLDTTLAQALIADAADALGISVDVYSNEVLPHIIASGGPLINSGASVDSPSIVQACNLRTKVCPDFFETHETIVTPAAMNATGSEIEHTFDGGFLYQLRTPQFPFARTMSQERTVLLPHAHRPMSWTSGANAIIVVIAGTVTIRLEGGIDNIRSDQATHDLIIETGLIEGDLFYIPAGRAYEIVEETGVMGAQTITVFDVGNWGSLLLSESIHRLPNYALLASLNVSAFDNTVDAHGQISQRH